MNFENPERKNPIPIKVRRQPLEQKKSLEQICDNTEQGKLLQLASMMLLQCVVTKQEPLELEKKSPEPNKLELLKQNLVRLQTKNQENQQVQSGHHLPPSAA